MMHKSFFADIMEQKYLLMQLKFSMKNCWRYKSSYPKNLIVKWGRWENCHIGKLLSFIYLHCMQESAFLNTKTFYQRKNICITSILLQHCAFSYQLKQLTATWESVHHYYPHLLQSAVHYMAVGSWLTMYTAKYICLMTWNDLVPWIMSVVFHLKVICVC